MDINTHEPPFQETYRALFQNSTALKAKDHDQNSSMVDNNKECELPLIDLDRLNFRYLVNDPLNNFQELDKCIEEMAEAASEWGFFQVVNHGIPRKVLDSMRYEEMKMFHQPFCKKSEENFMNLSADSYRWGNPTATCLRQFSWSEAFHIPLTDISRLDVCNNSRSAIGLFVKKAAGLARRIAECLAQNLGVGGLQLMKDGKWHNVKPNPEVLIVNIGDLFQAVSNGVYKSIEHRVVAHPEVERFSMAYFYCPSHEAVIESCSHPAVYRKFSFREYRQQIQMDVRATGDKVGLSRFLLQ
ncbi:hypothetical protein LWI28_014419 [Acer negundo]|uniref:Fe2OG dioxygenase domain-containing protein n=1 Tax=Acer negundo TaxID=4023 RepID=A0AAD5J612_ACENE|nr:hypothetical protein LWI28_014419 [Acer negundo]